MLADPVRTGLWCTLPASRFRDETHHMSTDKSAAQLRAAFEAALVAEPDDLAAHSAYADFLTEQDDPRGELISVQLARERASGAERDRLAQREAVLLAQQQAAGEGLVGGFFRGRNDITYRFRRGWLDDVEVRTMRDDLAAKLAGAPELRLLRRLAVINLDGPVLDPAAAHRTRALVNNAWFDPDEEAALVPLRNSPETWANLRVFQLGDAGHERCDVGDGPIAELIEMMPRLEVLHLFVWRLEEAARIFTIPLPHLRELHVGGVFYCPVSALAENATLGRLEDLMLQPAAPNRHTNLPISGCTQLVHSPHLISLRHLRLSFVLAGDHLCDAVVQSGILRRLRTLEIPYSQITDAGAAALAGSPDLARLERLDLVGNQISDEGIARLSATGVALAWQPQAEEEPAVEEDDVMEDEWE
jgi:uncharacterized protein (TIGR02996 family)